MSSNQLHKASSWFFIIACGLVAYWRALDNFFYGDDFGFISEARAIHLFRPDELWQGIISIIQPFWFRAEFVFFFINNLLESAFGLNPFLYHLHNILLHILIGWLVFGFLLKLSGSYRVSFLSCLVFLLNPLPAEAVYWYTGAHTLYVALFIALTLWAYARGFYKSSVFSLVLAMFSKPDASVLPVYIFLTDMLLFGGSSLSERWKRLRCHILAALLAFVVYAFYYRNAATWLIPEHRFQFHLAPDFPAQLFANFSYLIIPLRRWYYLTFPFLFCLPYLNLNSRQKRMLVFSAGFVFFSILPYQLFIVDPRGFYFWRDETLRYFYIPAMGQAFLAAGVLDIALDRLSRRGRNFIYGCAGLFFLFQAASLARLDDYFEQREKSYKTLVGGVRPYFKKGDQKSMILFNYPSFADPNLSSFYTSDLPLISELFFERRLISVTELKSLPDSLWLKDKYPVLPKRENAELLEFEAGRIKRIPEQGRDSYYEYFVKEAQPLYLGSAN